MNFLKFGIPSGSLMENSLSMLSNSGIKIIKNGRNYELKSDLQDFKFIILSPREIPKFVERGILDMGIAGFDWIKESNVDIKILKDLKFSKKGTMNSRIVVAVPQNSTIKSITDLNGKRIATEYPNLATELLHHHQITARIDKSCGATEGKIYLGYDAIVEITETGASLKANNLQIIHTLQQTSAKLIANKNTLKNPQKQMKILEIAQKLHIPVSIE